jgi:hypothetical protein
VGDGVELAAQLGDAVANLAAVELERALARPLAPDAAALTVAAAARLAQPRREVAQPRNLHLEPRLAAAGVTVEDLQDDRGAVEHRRARRALEILQLGGAELVVDHHQGGGTVAQEHRRVVHGRVVGLDGFVPCGARRGHVEVEIVGGLGGLGGFGSGGRFGGGLGLLVDAAVARLRTRGNHPGAARAVCEHLQLALPQHHARRELAAALGDAADDGVPQGGDETSQLGEGALEVAFAHVGELDAHEHGALGRVGGILHGVGRAGHGLGPRDHSTDGLWAIAQRWALAGRRGCE